MAFKKPVPPNGTRRHLHDLLGRTDTEIVVGLLEQGGAPPFEPEAGGTVPVTAAFVKYAERVLDNIENPFAKRLLQNGVEIWNLELEERVSGFE